MATTKPADGRRWKHACVVCGRPVKAHTSYSQVPGQGIAHLECRIPLQQTLRI